MSEAETGTIHPENMDMQLVGSEKGMQMWENGIEFSGEVDYRMWTKKGEELTRVVNVMQKHMRWWIGDWIAFGQSAFPDMYSQALEKCQYEYGTLRNAVWVCSNVPLSNRNPKLSFEHHLKVARLDTEAQRRWLTEADVEGWSAKVLDRHIREEAAFGKVPEDRVKRDKPEKPEDFKGGSDDDTNQTMAGTVENDTPAIVLPPMCETFDDFWVHERSKLDGLLQYDSCKLAFEAGVRVGRSAADVDGQD